MNLEDHPGDIVRKARTIAGVAISDAAKAARISTDQLAALEESGAAPSNLDFAGLGSAIGLHGAKLGSIAKGWLPAPQDLARWRELRQISTTEGGNTVHCYLVWDEVTRDAALFDTGWDAAPVLQAIRENQLQLKHLFITHTHIDHMAGLGAVRQEYPKAILHTDARSAPPQHRNRRNDCISLGSLRITNRDTPGHAEDGVTYLVGNWPDDAPHVAIVGDCIFAGSIGGAPAQGHLAKEKVRDQILSLPGDTLLCPGHGPLTTVAEEKAHNPFFG